MKGKIFIAGHRGMVGSALLRALKAEHDAEVLTAGREKLDLLDQAATRKYLRDEKPTMVIVAAAKVGGILANDRYPVDFLLQNLSIAANLIEGADRANVERLAFLGSSCIYPPGAPQPLQESALLSGPLEPTNQWYAVAKIAGIKLVEAFRRQKGRRYISVMPCNLYGPNDNFDPLGSHVLPALIRRIHQAKISGAPEVTIWGSGAPRREFLHVDDLARAVLLCLDRYDDDPPINCGAGGDVSIAELAELVAQTVGFRGNLRYDREKPDGAARKLMDSSKIFALGFRPEIDLARGLAETYAWYIAQEVLRGVEGSA